MTITREEIKEKLDNNDTLILVEALPQSYFEAEHLPNAINIPHDEIQVKASKMLPNKNSLIIVYCANTECQNSNMAINLLRQMGYTNTFEYVEGKQDWIEADLPTESNA